MKRLETALSGQDGRYSFHFVKGDLTMKFSFLKVVVRCVDADGLATVPPFQANGLQRQDGIDDLRTMNVT